MKLDQQLTASASAWLTATLVLMLLIAVHFWDFFFVSWHNWIWGISASADPVGVIANGFTLYSQLLNGCPTIHAYDSFPFGSQIAEQFTQLMKPQWWLMWPAMLFQDSIIVAYNTAILLTFVVNYLVIYAISLRWCSKYYVAILPAVLITFSSYTFAHSLAHLGLLAVFGIPLFFVLAVDFFKLPSIKLALGLGATAALNLYISPYYFYFSACTAVALAGFYLANRGIPTKQHLMLSVWALVTFAALTVPFLHDQFLVNYGELWGKAQVSRSYSDNFDHLYAYSARPSDYLVSNVHSSLFGHHYAGLVADLGNRRNLVSDELPIALGTGLLVFLLYFIATAPLNRVNTPTQRAIAADPFTFAAAAIIIVLAFLMSLPPTLQISGFDIPMLNESLREFVPFRSYSRFALVVLCLAALLLARVIDHTRQPKIWTLVVILLATIEVHPNFYLHPTYAERDYIAYLRDRPETAIMRFEAQTPGNQRRGELEAILTGKQTMNGMVNRYIATTEWLLNDRPTGFVAGHLADMGTELLVVDGPMNLTEADQPYVEFLAAFPEEDINIWKLVPTGNPAVSGLFTDLIEQRRSNACYVTPKHEVEARMQQLYRVLAAPPSAGASSTDQGSKVMVTGSFGASA